MSVFVGTVASPHSFADELLGVAHDALADTRGGQIERRYVVHQTPSVDCEMLAVIIGPVTMRGLVVSELGTAHRYKDGWLNIVTFQILVARDCIPVGSDNGDPPTPEQHTETLRLCAEDVWAIWNSIPARMAEGDLFAGACSELFMDNAAPVPVQGMSAGWLITLRTSVPGYVT